MKQFFIILFLLSVIFLSCDKKNRDVPGPRGVEHWEKFIRNYKVYDTIGNYLYDMEIVHHSTIYHPNGNTTDSLILQNFADTFDLKFEFSEKIDKNMFDFGILDSIPDKNNKHWLLVSYGDDPATPVKENYLFNDTIIFYFKMNNIKYYIQEAQPYFFCKCKHVAVVQ